MSEPAAPARPPTRTAVAAAATLAAGALLAHACSGATHGSIALRPAFARAHGELQIPGDERAPADVDRFRVCVAGDFAPVCGEAFLSQGAVELALEVPRGTGRTVIFEGYDRADPARLLWCGRRGGVQVRGAAETVVKLPVSRCGGFALARNSTYKTAFGTATALADGRVLVAGGVARVSPARDAQGQELPYSTLEGSNGAFQPGAVAAIYDPDTASFDAPFTLDRSGRILHTATLLPDGKRVLLAGGQGTHRFYYNSVQAATDFIRRENFPQGATAIVVDANTRAVREFALLGHRLAHQAVPLPDGSVLLAGGIVSDGAPLFERVIPDEERSEAVEIEGGAHRIGGGVVLRGGAPVVALLVGGAVLPAPSGSVGFTGDPGPWLELLTMSEPPVAEHPVWAAASGSEPWPARFAAVLPLSGGGVLVAGGALPGQTGVPGSPDAPALAFEWGGTRYAPRRPLDRAVRIDPDGKTVVELPAMTQARAFAAAAVLPDGRALVAGGLGCDEALGCSAADGGSSSALATAELFDAGAGEWAAPASLDPASAVLARGRLGAAVAPLPDGTVLLVGGLGVRGQLDSDDSGPLSPRDPTAELFNPTPPVPFGAEAGTGGAGGTGGP